MTTRGPSRRASPGYWGKRALDWAIAIVVAVPALALCLVVGPLVWIFLGRPILFTQERPGQHGRPFRLIKFRTMRTPEPGETSDHDGNRLTPFGRWLRSTSLDEIPEILNVVRGEMSFVGPRPLLMEYLPLYDGEQARRMEVKPGITGWAQINGRNAISWSERFALDTWYVDHATLWLDLEILARTAWRVVRRDGISQAGHPTMNKFSGNGGSQL